ncbi:MAG TPA: DUF2867 domain-containing protein [Verrucomicrobiota bacterium]|nr:DUF2867 domain-containing protein [Verrucomicrobiota bacterium]HRT09104.1 DUF2867 domain-containing protein [Candidatus Paceibacterota bacterium]HRT58414.1 DUF2867 domain-containing protein [Candidatus Paceibacterota bacterium]
MNDSPLILLTGASGYVGGRLRPLLEASGWLDLLAGGAGMRRGRRHPEHLSVGEVVDCWRVEAMEPNRRLRLAAEMKLPGRAWLEFEVTPKAEGHASVIRQTAVFDPVGLAGIAYWYALFPLHQLVFAGMLRGIGAAAGRADGTPAKVPGARGGPELYDPST